MHIKLWQYVYYPNTMTCRRMLRPSTAASRRHTSACQQVLPSHHQAHLSSKAADWIYIKLCQRLLSMTDAGMDCRCGRTAGTSIARSRRCTQQPTTWRMSSSSCGSRLACTRWWRRWSGSSGAGSSPQGCPAPREASKGTTRCTGPSCKRNTMQFTLAADVESRSLQSAPCIALSLALAGRSICNTPSQ